MDFFKGMFYLFSGFSNLFVDGLKRFIFLPILFNILLFILFFYVIYHYVFPYSHEYVDKLPSWLSFLNSLIFIIFAISFFLLFLSMFTVLFNLVAAPFNGLLAEKAQNVLYKTKIPQLSISEIATRTIKRQCQFLGYFIPRFIGMLALFFIPVIHPVYPFLWLMFTAWILSIQYQDFVMDNNLVNFREMRFLIKGRGMLSLGFGMGINVISFIPLLNLLAIPAAVIGGVILYFEEYNRESLDKITLVEFLNHK